MEILIQYKERDDSFESITYNKGKIMNLHELHPQYITNANGEKISVILPMQTFETLLEDMQDLAVIAERRNDVSSPHSELMLELKRDGLI